jgi:hypothetical protein
VVEPALGIDMVLTLLAVSGDFLEGWACARFCSAICTAGRTAVCTAVAYGTGELYIAQSWGTEWSLASLLVCKPETKHHLPDEF